MLEDLLAVVAYIVWAAVLIFAFRALLGFIY